jgi:hypothetical protein
MIAEEDSAMAEFQATAQRGSNASMTEKLGPLRGFWKAVKEFIWGLAFLEMYRETLKEKRKYEDVLNIVLLGEFLGLPLMNSTITLRLLPYLFPQLRHWRQRQLTEQDITDHLPEAHLH